MAQPPARRSQYTNDEKARAYLHIQTYNNLSQTERELGISRATLTQWRKEWDTKGLPPEIADLVREDSQRFRQQAELVRDAGLAKLLELINKADDPKLIVQVATAIGIVQDKVNMMSKVPEARSQRDLPDGEQLARGLGTFVGEMMAVAQDRRARLDDDASNVVEEQPFYEGLPAPDKEQE